MNDLIKDRDERTRKRKKTKRKMDALIGLSKTDEKNHRMELSASKMELKDKSIRLLDEGFIDNGFIIKKGTLEKFLEGKNENVRIWEMNEDGEWERSEVMNLTDDFVGTVNLGHMDFASFPFIIGEWSKEDLKLVDIGNGRKGLDVDLHLDKDSMFVKELKRQPYDIGVSAEFWYHVNEEDTQSVSEMLGYYIPVFDEVYINAYGLVGECGNVNSSGLELKGEDMADKEKLVDTLEVGEAEDLVEVELSDEEPTEETIELDATEEDIVITEPSDDAEAGNEEDIEESEKDDEDGTEDATEEVSEEDEVEEVIEDDEEDEVEETDELDEVAEAVAELTERIEALETENAELKAQCETLKKTNRRLNKKLSGEIEKKEKFCASVKNISVKLGVNESKNPKKEVTEAEFAFGDGIGD